MWAEQHWPPTQKPIWFTKKHRHHARTLSNPYSLCMDITNHHLARAKERLKDFSAVFFLDTGMVVNQSKTTIYDYMGGVLKIEFPVQPFLCNQGSRATNFTASFMSTLAALNVQDLELYDWATEQFL